MRVRLACLPFLIGLCAASLASARAASAAPVPAAVISDPIPDRKYPAQDIQLLIPSHGLGLNALLFAASGPGAKPTVILMHGLPGLERNLDLAQAIRRAGWNVLTFTYRGAWGSPGDFSISNAMEDGDAALAFARSPEGAKVGIDADRVVLMGHSLGGAVATMTAAKGRPAGLVLLDATNTGLRRQQMISGGEQGRLAYISRHQDFGNALHDTSPAKVADEIIAQGAAWDLNNVAPQLRYIPLLSVYATRANAAENKALLGEVRRAGGKDITGVELDTGHSFTDRRVTLTTAVVRWLMDLEKRL